MTTPSTFTKSLRRGSNSVQNAVPAIAIAVALIALWEISARVGWHDTFLFSSPSAVIEVLSEGLAEGSVWTNMGVTISEVLLGYTVGAIGGSAVGLALWFSLPAARLSLPFLLAIGSIPILAVAPLLIIWFGTGIESKVVIVTLSCVVVAIVNAYRGTQEADIDLLNLMRSLGGSRFVQFQRVVLPGAMPWVFQGLNLNVGFALIGAIVGEFISSDSGVGNMIVVASARFSLSDVFAGLVLVILLVAFLTALLRIVERRVLRWKNA